MKNTLKKEINRINQLLKEEMFPEPLDRLMDTQNNIEDMAQNVIMMGGEVDDEERELDDVWGEYGEDFTEKQIDDISGAIHDLGDAAQSLEDAEDELRISHVQLDDLTKSLQGLNEMRFDGKSTGLFSDEETTMNELEIDEGHCGDSDLDEGHCSSKGLDEDEEEEVSMARKNRVLRRPYSSSAKFKAGLSEQERPPLALDRELSFVLDEIHDDLFYTLPGQFQEYNLGEQVRLYQELKSRLDSYPASKSLPEVKQILDRMEYDLSGLEGFNERLGELFYILTGRYEFSPEARRNS